MSTRYATCFGCGYAIPMWENKLLKCAIDCPRCRRERAFGHGVFIEDFEGYDISEVLRQQTKKPSAAHRDPGDEAMSNAKEYAVPVPTEADRKRDELERLRDELAMAALNGLLAKYGLGEVAVMAADSYEIADCMLAARKVKL
jgi:hypothetical protein